MSIITSPLSGCKYQATSLTNVDFPHHDGQTSAVFCFAKICIVKLLNTCVPSGYLYSTSCKRISQDCI